MPLQQLDSEAAASKAVADQGLVVLVLVAVVWRRMESASSLGGVLDGIVAAAGRLGIGDGHRLVGRDA